MSLDITTISTRKTVHLGGVCIGEVETGAFSGEWEATSIYDPFFGGLTTSEEDAIKYLVDKHQEKLRHVAQHGR